MELPNPTVIASFKFSPDFQLESSEGDFSDSESLTIFLPTLLRSITNCGDVLDLGDFKSIHCWGQGKGIRVDSLQESIILELLDDVFEPYSFMGVQSPVNGYTSFPLCSPKWQLKNQLRNMPELLWYGFRDNESNEWDQNENLVGTDMSAVQKATMLILQTDILLKGHDLPRTRGHICFSEGTFWFWSASNDDYFMLIQKNTGKESMGKIALIGEAFLMETGTI